MKRFGLVLITVMMVGGCGKHSKKIVSQKNPLIIEDDLGVERAHRAAITVKAQGPRELVDRFLARVNGVNILLSDVQEPHIDRNCEKMSLDELINEELWYQKALEMKLTPQDTDVERRFVAIKNHNGFSYKTDEQFESWFKKETGLTIKKLKRQLMKAAAIDAVKNMYVHDKCFVDPKEIEAYYVAHPEYHEEKYKLKSAFVPKEQLDADKALIVGTELSWLDLGWINKSAITESMEFLMSLPVGTISPVVQTEHGYQVFMVEGKELQQLCSIEERYAEIEKALFLAERERVEKEFTQQLRGRASLVYFE